MRVLYYPDSTENEEGGGPVRREIKALLNERPPVLWAIVRETMEKLRKSNSLADLERQGWVERMPHVKEPIYEFRIPPGKRSEGVFRIYFALKKNDSGTVILLSAEKKHGRNKADHLKVEQAIQRYRNECK